MLATLIILSKNHHLLGVVSYSQELNEILKCLNIRIFKSIKDSEFNELLKKADLLLSVHGREIVPLNILRLPHLKCINIHPYLYKYKGAYPIKQALEEKNWRASVGAHFMTEKIDEGEVIVEEFKDVDPKDSEEEIYNQLYFLYCKVIIKVLEYFEDKM